MKDRPLLSICVPTHNREAYLRHLLPELLRQAEAVRAQGPQIEVLVLDNASTDGTDAYLRGGAGCGFVHIRHPANIGGDRNFLACVDRASGRFVWLFGDDDCVEPTGIARVCEALGSETPELLILPDCGGETSGVPCMVRYDDYAAFLRAAGPSGALAHTLISGNVFARDSFDGALARRRLPTNYAHAYGIIGGLRGGPVLTLTHVLRVRRTRAPFERHPMALCIKQGAYLWWLAARFSVPGFRPWSLRLFANWPVEVLSLVWRSCLRRKKSAPKVDQSINGL